MEKQVAVITGGSTGIGLAVAEKLAKRGDQVVLFARDSSDLEKACELIPDAMHFSGDVTQAKDQKALFQWVNSKLGRVDKLFVNAGIAEFASLEDADEAHFDRLFQTNVKGAFLTLKHAAPLFQNGTSVVFNTSVAAVCGAPSCSVYGASKGAVMAFARNMAAELLSRGVRINSVAPGPTETPIQAKASLSEAQMNEMAPYVMQRMRMGRMGQAHEIASLVDFLLSPEATFIVGQHIAADGGMTGL